MSRDESIDGIGRPASDPRVAADASVALHEPPGGEPLRFWQGREEWLCRRIVERKNSQRLPAIDRDDDPRRPAAEASPRVVEQNRALERHAIQIP